MQRNLRLPILVLAASLLASCAAPGPTPEERAALEGPARELLARGAYREAALAWQQAAARTDGELAVEYRLNAADALIDAGDGPGATAVVAALPESLTPDHALRRALVLADAALLAGDTAEALRRVGPGVTSTDAALVARYRRIRAEALELAGDPLGAARELALRDALLTESQEVYRNRRAIWDRLGAVPTDVLDAQLAQPPQVVSGWIELARIARHQALDVDALEAAIAQWTLRYPGHPAGEQIVPELVERVRAEAQPPTKVVVLLPQSGPFAAAAAAIRDGFMAAWFADAPNPQRPEVILRDSAEGDIALTYASAIAEGAQFAVGPLAKETVNALVQDADLSVTTLTLNHPSEPAPATAAPGSSAPGAEAPPAPIDASTMPAAPVEVAAGTPPPADASAAPAAGAAARNAPAPRDLQRVFHFALAPEEEAVRVAERAFARGARQAALLSPEGDWGARVGDAFTARWLALGGIVVERQVYPEEATGLSNAVERLLNVDESEERARGLRRTLGREIVHEPTPRQDVDVVFLAAFPQAARQLRPLLLFHRAGDLPVIATSHAYSGTPDANADQDIDGLEFGDMPWVVNPDLYVLPARVRRAWRDAAGGLGRLYAFGADAYGLIAELRRLRSVPGSEFVGLTGRLSLGADRRLQRRLDWAVIRSGLPVAEPADAPPYRPVDTVLPAAILSPPQ